MLNALVELAKETSPDSRRNMLDAVARLFVDGVEAHNARELELFGDILLRLIDRAAEDDRIALSRRIARLSQTAHPLALKLARDQALIAVPILEFSPVLTVPDLIDIAHRSSQDHLMAISRRAEVAEPVTAAVLNRAGVPVLNTITRNLGARFTPESLEWIAQRAKVEPSIGESLSMRPDLPAQIVRKISGLVSPEASLRIEQALQQGGDRVADLMGRAMRLLDTSRTEQPQLRSEIRKMLADVRSGHRKIDDAVDELIFHKRLADIATFLAGLASVNETHVSNVLHKVNAAGIGMVCRLIGLAEPTFRRLSCLRCEKLRLPMSQAEQMLKDYAGIDMMTAEQSLKYHKVHDDVQTFLTV